MVFTYLLANDIGKVRLLVPDNKPAAYIFENDEITAMLTLEGDDVRCAAALALETMASDEAYVQKVIRILDLSTNGAATAAALMARAARLREQAAAADVTGLFDWAEMVTNDFSMRERLDAEALRDA